MGGAIICLLVGGSIVYTCKQGGCGARFDLRPLGTSLIVNKNQSSPTYLISIHHCEEQRRQSFRVQSQSNFQLPPTMELNITTMSTSSDGAWQGDNPLHHAFPLLIVQTTLILFVSRLLALLLKPLRQPKVIAEILVLFFLLIYACLCLKLRCFFFFFFCA